MTNREKLEQLKAVRDWLRVTLDSTEEQILDTIEAIADEEKGESCD